MNKWKFTAVVKTWFDRINGNTYHSVRITRHSDGALVVCSFRYGYGDHYKQTALYVMFEAGWFRNYRQKRTTTGDRKFCYTENSIFSFERDQNYPILWTVSEGLKRDCVANGKI